MTETPTLREELDRKVLDYLHNRETRRIQGNISPSVIGIEAGALWDVLCGLIDNDAAQLLAQLEAAAQRPPIKRYFLLGSSALVLTFNPAGAGWVLYSQPTPKVIASNSTDVGPLRDQRLTTLVSGLLTKGYKEIT